MRVFHRIGAKNDDFLNYDSIPRDLRFILLKKRKEEILETYILRYTYVYMFYITVLKSQLCRFK